MAVATKKPPATKAKANPVTPPAAAKAVEVAISAITLDDSTQSREATNQDIVEQYAERLREGDIFPAVDLFTSDGEEFFPGDGIHRCHAHVVAKLSTIMAIVHRVADGQDAVHAAKIFACGANKSHGLHRSNADKRRSAEIMLELEPKWSNAKIAQHCGIGDQLVADVRRELEATEVIQPTSTRVGADGKERPANQPRESRGSVASASRRRRSQVSESDTCATPKDTGGLAGGTAFDDEYDDGDEGVAESESTATPATTIDELAAPYKRAVNDIHRIMKDLKSLSLDQPKGAHLAGNGGSYRIIIDHLKTANDTLKAFVPAALCPTCDGSNQSCRDCLGSGFITKDVASKVKERAAYAHLLDKP